MNICFFLGGFFSNGGIGRVTSIIANNLSKNDDYTVYTLSFANLNKSFLYEIDEKIQNEFLFDSPMTMKKAICKNIVGKIKKYLIKNNIDILVACGDLYFIPSVLACKKTKVKCICWDHTAPDVVTDHQFQNFSKKFGAKRSDLNVLLTKAAKETYDEYFCDKKKNYVIYNPIDPRVVEARREYRLESKKIITVGRLTYQKNYEDLVLVAKEVLDKHKDWIWDIYGDGELKEEISKEIKDKHLEDRLIMKGQVKNLYDLYNEYSFIVMTSRYEGFPMTLLEASANGLPLISFDIKTGPNEIINGENGYLIHWDERKNSNMSNAIDNLISDIERRKKYSVESLNTSRLFEIDNIIECWNNVFSNIMK